MDNNPAPGTGGADASAGVAARPSSSPHLAIHPEMSKHLGLDRGARWRRVAWRAVKLTIVVAVLVLTVRMVQRVRRPNAPAQYVTTAVSRGELRVVVSATGRVEAATTIEVGAEVSGRITRLLVDDNARVTRGQLLAEIDPQQLAAEVAQQRAQLAAARATVRQARATVTEQEQLSTRTSALAALALATQQNVESNQASVERARAAYDVAVANAQLAEAGGAAARSRLDKATIRSPIDGIVLARLVEPGQTVTAGFTTPVLFKLAEDLTRMILRVDVDEADIGRVRHGNLATFTVDSYPGRQFSSRVVSVRNEPKIEQNVVTYEAELEVINTDLSLRPGMTATATMVTEVRADVLLVANAALRFLPPGVSAGSPVSHEGRVWLAPKPRSAATRAGVPVGEPVAVALRLGASDGINTEVVGGELAANTLVIIDSKDTP